MKSCTNIEQSNVIMKITAGKVVECFVFLPTLSLCWKKTSEGNIYSLGLVWLCWYIAVLYDKKL